MTTVGARPRPGSSRLVRLLVGACTAALLGGCALGGSDADSSESPSDEVTALPRELSARPEPLRPIEVYFAPPTSTPADEDEDDDAADGDRTDATPGGGSGGGGGGGKGEDTGTNDDVDPADVFPPPPPGGQGSSSTRLVQIDDGAGDAGRNASYADVLRVTVVDTDGRAVVTLDAAGDIPDPLPEGEVMGIGVDLFVGGSSESDYQLFADGSADGWYAYLHTPRGIARFPGDFRLGGQRMVFDVPWSALGAPSSGRVSAFADWSRGSTAVNPYSEDFAPDEGTRSFSR